MTRDGFSLLVMRSAVVNQYKSDTEYIYSLCEYTNLLTYASDNPRLMDENWEDKLTKKELQDYAKARRRSPQTGVYLFPSQR